MSREHQLAFLRNQLTLPSTDILYKNGNRLAVICEVDFVVLNLAAFGSPSLGRLWCARRLSE
jgi:hypothetical protein